MGYDFTIGVMRSGNPQTDLSDFTLDETTIEMQLDYDKFNKHMSRFPGISKNGSSWRWDVPEGGTLDISISDFMIYVDTHADWLAVLEIYLYIRSIEPRAFLLEDAICGLHNEYSFRDMIFTPRSWSPDIDPDQTSIENLNSLFDELCFSNRDRGIQLFSLQEKAAPLIPRIEEILRGPLKYNYLDLIHLISYIGQPATSLAPQLAKVAQQSNAPVLHHYVFIALGNIRATDPCAISFLIKSLNQAEVWDRHNILEALLKMKQEQLAIPLLFEHMASADMNHPGCWASSFADLFKYVRNAKPVIPELEKLLQQEQPIRRLVAALAMDALATRQHSECEILTNLASKDTWERIRRIAVITLARLPRTDRIRDSIQCLAEDNDQEVRARATWALEFGVIQTGNLD